jgi:hypothetical protein
MSLEQRTAELDTPIDIGERDVDHDPRPEIPEVEPREESRDTDSRVDVSEALAQVTDEEIKSGAVYEKLATHSAKERGGVDEEVRVNTAHDSRNLGYFNAEGVRINKDTGNPAIEDLLNYYKDKKSEEELADIKTKFNEIDRQLLENPNTFILVNDREVTIDGVKLLQVGYAIVDSEGRVSYLDVDHIPAEEESEGEDFSYGISEVANDTDIDVSQSENAQISTDAEELTDTNAVFAAEEITIENSEEVLEEALTQLFAEPEATEKAVEQAHSIIDRLSREFGFTYGKSEVSTAVPAIESNAKVIEKVVAIPANENVAVEPEEQVLTTTIKEAVTTETLQSIQAEESIGTQSYVENREVVSTENVVNIMETNVIPETVGITLVFNSERTGNVVPQAEQTVLKEREAEVTGIVEKTSVNESIFVSLPKGQENSVITANEVLQVSAVDTQKVFETKVLDIKTAEPLSEINIPKFEIKEAIVNQIVETKTIEAIVRTNDEQVLVSSIEARPFATNAKEVASVTTENLKVESKASFEIHTENSIPVLEQEILTQRNKEVHALEIVTDSAREFSRSEASPVFDRLNLGQRTTPFMDDPQAANDNRAEISASNGIIMRRAA